MKIRDSSVRHVQGRGAVSWEPEAFAAHDKGMNNSLNYFLSILWFVLWIVALVDCVKSNNPNKVVWIIVIILLPFLGSILYFLLGRRTA
jgi:hypothetical protein